MPHAVAIDSLPRAFEVMKSMSAAGVEWGEGYRAAGRQALREVIEGRMRAAVDQHLEAMAGGVRPTGATARSGARC